MTRAVLLLALLVAACGEPVAKYEQAEPAPPPPAPAPAVVEAPPPTPVLAWEGLEDGGLVLKQDGRDLLRLGCKDGQMTVRAEGLDRVESEDRMSVGSGDVVAALAAVPVSDPMVTGVAAGGEADAALLSAIEAGGGKIAVNYGAQNVGPFDPPAPELARAFVASCRP